ncbi:LysM peptidoglycan-binding domain-containing protein [Enterococcus canis]|nr:LysM peptidoglycan-binding domain-containing protein [Enterococcus canis]
MKNKEFKNITVSEKVERKTIYKAKKKWLIKSLLFSTVLGGSLLLSDTSAFADENDGVWIARTAEQIKEEINGNEYLIKWGDTLSAISEAINISITRLAEINQIENVDLIFAGNKLVFGAEIDKKTGEDNRVVAVQGQDGKTKVVMNTDENKPVVNQTETDKAKNVESNGGTYTPPKNNDTNTNQNTEKPTLPSAPEPPVQPETPVEPEKPIDPEPPVNPEKPIDPENPTPVIVDKTVLTNLFNSVTNLISTEYTPDSWNNFKVVRNESQALLQNTDATQDEVDTMVSNLQNVIAGLVKVEQPVQVDKAALVQLYNSVTDLTSTDYETNSWNTFKTVREQAKVIIQDTNATQVQVDNMTTALQQTIDGLVKAEQPAQTYKSALQALINEVKDYQADSYTAESWNSFHQAFSEAVTVLANENATQEEIDNAKDSLETAKNNLVKQAIINKDALISLYNSTSSYDPDKFTDSSWNKFIQVKAEAKQVINDKNATQKQVDDIKQKLQNAINQLEEKQDTSDFSKLPEKTPTYSASMTAKFESALNAYRQAKGFYKNVYIEWE